MKVKTQNLIGDSLDFAVAKADGYFANFKQGEIIYSHPEGNWHHNNNWHPSINWHQAGPIIERERMAVQPLFSQWLAGCSSAPDSGRAAWSAKGPTLLVAAMRCFVASKLGSEVDIPEQLLNNS